MIGNYMDEMIDTLRKAGALEAFGNVVCQMRDAYVHDIVKANDDNVMHAIRGQISICNMLADTVSAALEADEAKANAAYAEGIPK